MMIEYSEIIFRLCSAVLIGSVIGLDRNLHGKPTGIKTLGLVALGASLTTMASTDFAFGHSTSFDISAVSRVIQGVITGIGFLGAGVIIHDRTTDRVRGLTTAASIWVTAAMGIVCGLGLWQIASVAMVIVLILFIVGRPLEKALHRRWLAKSVEEKEAIARHEE
jgi:putative Mg2+ transporter-C (MgtC) family protein